MPLESFRGEEASFMIQARDFGSGVNIVSITFLILSNAIMG
jgi:hypothetical protein